MMGVDGTAPLNVQKEGWLWKRPFTGSAEGAWQKRYFVLKDSFLLWYDDKVSGVPFNTKPKGALPIGGASVFPMGKDVNDYLFEITHPDFNHSMVLKSPDKQDVDDWIQVMTDCRKATYGNALLGNAMMGRIKSVGTAMEAQMQRALEEAERYAMELETIREEKWKVMMEHMELERTHNEAKNDSLNEAQRLREEKAKVEAKVQAERKAKEAATRERAELEKQLGDARERVKQLSAALKTRESQNPSKPAAVKDITSALAVIEAFFSKQDSDSLM